MQPCHRSRKLRQARPARNPPQALAAPKKNKSRHAMQAEAPAQGGVVVYIALVPGEPQIKKLLAQPYCGILEEIAIEAIGAPQENATQIPSGLGDYVRVETLAVNRPHVQGLENPGRIEEFRPSHTRMLILAALKKP